MELFAPGLNIAVIKLDLDCLKITLSQVFRLVCEWREHCQQPIGELLPAPNGKLPTSKTNQCRWAAKKGAALLDGGGQRSGQKDLAVTVLSTKVVSTLCIVFSYWLFLWEQLTRLTQQQQQQQRWPKAVSVSAPLFSAQMFCFKALPGAGCEIVSVGTK